MDDTEVVRHITELADEEHALERSHAGTGLSAEETARLRAVEVALDETADRIPTPPGSDPREWSRATSSDA